MSDTHKTDDGQQKSPGEHLDEQAGRAANADLIDQARRRVVWLYRGEILDHAAELCNDEQQANATVDQAFARAFDSWRECGRAGNFRSWVRGIVTDLSAEGAEG